MTEKIFIPEAIQDVTPQWLNESLAGQPAFEGSEIVDFQPKQLGEGEGFLGDIFRLSLTYKETGSQPPTSLVVKIPKKANRPLGELLGAYERESMFFETIVDDVPARTPQCYYGAFDRDRGSENQQPILAFADGLPTFLAKLVGGVGLWIATRKRRRYILVIEDIAKARGGDQVAGASVDTCRDILRAIAKTHAAFWQRSGLADHFWLLPQNIDTRMRHQMFLKARPAFKKAFGDLLDEGMDAYVKWLEPRGVAVMQALMASAPETLVHSDLRLDNILFDQERDDEIVVIDWQLVRRGAAAYDVAYLLSGALKSAEHPSVVEELLVEYHRALSDAGVSDYDFDRFKRDYQRGLLLCLQTLTTIDQVDMGDDRGLELQKTWMRRLLARLRDVDLDTVLA